MAIRDRPFEMRMASAGRRMNPTAIRPDTATNTAIFSRGITACKRTIAYRCADRTKDLPYLLLHWSNCEARVDSMWPSDQTRKVTGELVLAGDYHQFALIDKAYIRAGGIHRASRSCVLDQCLKFHVGTRWVPFLR